ncbi:class I SAM-dependent methyltransferase [Thermodesulfobacteriota bacterium]
MSIKQEPTCPVCLKLSKRLFPALYGPIPEVAGIFFKLDVKPWIHECSDCGVRFTHPFVPQETLDSCYEKAGSFVWKDDPHNAKRRGFPSMVRVVEQEVLNKSILDVGCYTGAFLECFPESWLKYGIEPSKEAAELARSRNIEIISNYIKQVKLPPNKFGCVSALSVLEHIADPLYFLRKLTYALAPGGILLLQTGDLSSLYSLLMGKYWCYYHKPEHILFFSFLSLKRLLHSLGLDVIKVERNVDHKKPYGLKVNIKHTLDVSVAVMNRFISPFRQKDKNYVLWAICCDHMVVYARKNDNK